MVGYTGGWLENLTYRKVCTDKTGHAEAVQIQFDPDEVSYEKLLQYRSMILYHTSEQELVAKKLKEKLQMSDKFNDKSIVIEIVPASRFYKAEEYHQKYYEKSGGVGSCYPAHNSNGVSIVH
jgi:peptide-methionine (S)-S-oxide reductase